jgi:hypothetical protein
MAAGLPFAEAEAQVSEIEAKIRIMTTATR